VANDDPHPIEQWLDETIADLDAGRTNTAMVLQRLRALSDQTASGDAEARQLVAAIDRLAAGLLDDADSAPSDLVSVLRRVRHGDPHNALGMLGLDPDTLRDTDELSSRYTLEGLLGKGGMGEVRAAVDRRIRRQVALKRLKAGPTTEAMIGRFLQEAQVTGQLEHPHIVPVYDIGVGPAATVFFTMKRVQGEPLDALVKAGRATRLERLDIFKKVCDAVAYAHDRGVVHRDLKPANIMVGAFGQVFVLDWGLAKLVDQPTQRDDDSGSVQSDRELLDIERTSFDQLMGTPAYMSPEQARGDHDAVGPHSDIYSLGTVLYVLLTDQRPFPKGPALLRRVREGRFPPAHRVADVPRELSAIVTRAMALDPARRYPDAGALRADIEAWQEGREVSAYRYTVFSRARRALARHGSLLAGLLLATGVLAAGAATVFALYAVGLGVALDRANQARRDAQSALADADLAMAIVDVEQGRFESAEQRYHDAESAIAELGRDPSASRVTRAWLAPRLTQAAWRIEGGRFASVAVAPDGRSALAWSTRDPADPTVSGGIVWLALPSGDVLRWIDTAHTAVAGIGFGPEGPVVAWHDDDTLSVHTLDGQPLLELSPHYWLAASFLAMHPDGLVVTEKARGTWWYDWDGTLRGGPWPVKQRRELDREGPLRRMERMQVRAPTDYGVFDLSTGTFARTGGAELYPLGDGWVELHESDVRGLDPEGNPSWTHELAEAHHLTVGGGHVVVHRDGRRLQLLDPQGRLTGEQNLVDGPSASQGSMTVLPDGSAALSLAEGVLSLSWLRRGPLSGGVATDTWSLELAVSDDGWLVATSGPGEPFGVQLRERVTGRLLRTFETDGPCLDLELVDDVLLAACLDAGLLRLPLDGGPPQQLLDAPVRNVASLDGQIFVVTADGLSRLGPDGIAATVPLQGSTWDLVALEGLVAASSRDHGHPAAFVFTPALQPVPTELPADAAYNLAPLPDGGLVASSQRGRVRRVHLPSGRVEELPVDSSETVMAVAASPEGDQLAVGRYDGSVERLDLRTGRSLGILPSEHHRAVVDLAWTPDGPLYLQGNGQLSTLDPDRDWPEPMVRSLHELSGEPAGAPPLHLARSAIAAGNWQAVATVAVDHPSLWDELSAPDAARAALVADDETQLRRALERIDELPDTTRRALRAR
jgi:hypothetical protein